MTGSTARRYAFTVTKWPQPLLMHKHPHDPLHRLVDEGPGRESACVDQ